MIRRPRGMTLIETMVVVTIAALLITVLLVFLIPNDDRRCRLEAERLAAFLTQASAESVMRDAPTRVVFEFGENTGRLDAAKVGAAITSELWERAEKTPIHEIEKPVRLDTVDTAAMPGLTSGTGYVVFKGERTEGAVVVLALEEIAYSVIVPPAGAEIRVERGRATRPTGGTFERAPLPDLSAANRDKDKLVESLPGTGLLTGGSGLPSIPPAVPRPNPPAANNDRPARDPAPANNNNDVSNDPPVPKTPNPSTPVPSDPPKQPEPPPEATPEPQPEEPNNQVPNITNRPCATDLDCNRWGHCSGTYCVAEPTGPGRALRVRNIRNPASIIDATIASVINQAIADGALNFVVPLADAQLYLVQAERDENDMRPVNAAGQNYLVNGQPLTLPVYSNSDQPSYPIEASTEDDQLECDLSRTCTGRYGLSSEQRYVELFIPSANYDPSAPTCQFQRLQVGL
ncbi:MAG: type II secretion system protein, partial [Myxococcales bacterium]|nr:type II secretion system protein [Myxococcales bacterium]